VTRSRPRPSILLAAAALACAALVCGCGGSTAGVPQEAAAVVDGSPITTATLDHWIGIAVNSAASGSGAVRRQPVPIPPDFTACVAYHRANDPKPAKGPAPTAASLRQECGQAYAGALDDVMFFLITAQWFQRQAAADHITVSDAAAESQVSSAEQAAVVQGEFASVPAMQRYLRSIGETSQDELYRGRIEALSSDLHNDALQDAPQVTQAEITAYYAAHRSTFEHPETRDLRILLAKTAASARRAIALLRAGTSFARVAREFSIDPETRARGGVLNGQTASAGGLQSNLAKAVFAAPVRRLEGPLRTSRGYVVFSVQEITPATPETLSEARSTITTTLIQQHLTQTSTEFIDDFSAKWLKQTQCSPAFAVPTSPPVCSNAPRSPASAPAGVSTP
jgi:parvulin-like peptidyl-prolyl isomerase